MAFATVRYSAVQVAGVYSDNSHVDLEANILKCQMTLQ